MAPTLPLILPKGVIYSYHARLDNLFQKGLKGTIAACKNISSAICRISDHSRFESLPPEIRFDVNANTSLFQQRLLLANAILCFKTTQWDTIPGDLGYCPFPGCDHRFNDVVDFLGHIRGCQYFDHGNHWCSLHKVVEVFGRPGSIPSTEYVSLHTVSSEDHSLVSILELPLGTLATSSSLCPGVTPERDNLLLPAILPSGGNQMDMGSDDDVCSTTHVENNAGSNFVEICQNEYTNPVYAILTRPTIYSMDISQESHLVAMDVDTSSRSDDLLISPELRLDQSALDAVLEYPILITDNVLVNSLSMQDMVADEMPHREVNHGDQSTGMIDLSLDGIHPYARLGLGSTFEHWPRNNHGHVQGLNLQSSDSLSSPTWYAHNSANDQPEAILHHPTEPQDRALDFSDSFITKEGSKNIRRSATPKPIMVPQTSFSTMSSKTPVTPPSTTTSIASAVFSQRRNSSMSSNRYFIMEQYMGRRSLNTGPY